ncbi:MAG TPA: 16S rRNA (cytidine(1402)-2'-O)-methyltransferase [Myxococcota bacterium]|nr:16S rRNA (cytidine(1402)-2'-O)-methyltransferase [Myxococcota bacterium]
MSEGTLGDARGTVYVVATPIGNLDDLSPRAARVLREVEVIACEDTRHTAILCQRFEIATPRVSLHAHNEARRVPELLARLARGAAVALVSDAGTPLISDPGERFVRAALDAAASVVPLPGPSALLAALVVSGFPTRPFAFAGFLPRKGAERARELAALAAFPGALVLYEAPNRAAKTLVELRAVLGPRRVALARELTKRHEAILRGVLGELELDELRGELTIVIEGPGELAASDSPSAHELDAELARLLAGGRSTRDAARELAARFGLSRRDAYALALARGSADGAD